jgi:hypothetical protein
MRTAPFPPPRAPVAKPIPPRPSKTSLTEGSSPEIVIVGEYESDDPAGQIHVVPQESATEGFLQAIDSFVGPMRARTGSKPVVQMCGSCGAPLTGDGLVCSQCNAPQPLG